MKTFTEEQVARIVGNAVGQTLLETGKVYGFDATDFARDGYNVRELSDDANQIVDSHILDNVEWFWNEED